MSSEQETETMEEDEASTEDEKLKKQREIHPLLVKRHAKYFERVLTILPGSLSNLDSNR